MTAIAFKPQPDNLAQYSSIASAILTSSVHRASGQATRTALELDQDQLNFVLDWARWEPALVAKYHRDWFGC